MRCALISDIHANIEALDATLARIDELGVDQIYCLGDLVGYHADSRGLSLAAARARHPQPGR
jgi:predicted phosphodiesterase